MNDQTHENSDRWAAAHEELRLALVLPREEATERANELLRTEVGQTLSADREATETVTSWNQSIERRVAELDDAPSTHDTREELEGLAEDRLKSESMEDASLKAMDADAVEVAKMLEAVQRSRKVELAREVGDMVVTLNTRTLSEDTSHGLIADHLGYSGVDFDEKYRTNPGFDPVARERAMIEGVRRSGGTAPGTRPVPQMDLSREEVGSVTVAMRTSPQAEASAPRRSPDAEQDRSRDPRPLSEILKETFDRGEDAPAEDSSSARVAALKKQVQTSIRQDYPEGLSPAESDLGR